MNPVLDLLGAYMLKTKTTKRQVADHLGIKSTTTLNHKLEGKSEFSLSEAGKLAQLLGCTLDELFPEP